AVQSAVLTATADGRAVTDDAGDAPPTAATKTPQMSVSRTWRSECLSFVVLVPWLCTILRQPPKQPVAIRETAGDNAVGQCSRSVGLGRSRRFPIQDRSSSAGRSNGHCLRCSFYVRKRSFHVTVSATSSGGTRRRPPLAKR